MARDMAGRIDRLEALAHAEQEELLSWRPDDQLQDVLEILQVHRWGGSVYPATDREIRILGALHAYQQLPAGEGEYQLPSGAVVSLTDNADGTTSVSVRGRADVEDLPEGTREYVRRMDPDRQPERDRQLCELWRARRGEGYS